MHHGISSIGNIFWRSYHVKIDSFRLVGTLFVIAFFFLESTTRKYYSTTWLAVVFMPLRGTGRSPLDQRFSRLCSSHSHVGCTKTMCLAALLHLYKNKKNTYLECFFCVSCKKWPQPKLDVAIAVLFRTARSPMGLILWQISGLMGLTRGGTAWRVPVLIGMGASPTSAKWSQCGARGNVSEVFSVHERAAHAWNTQDIIGMGMAKALVIVYLSQLHYHGDIAQRLAGREPSVTIILKHLEQLDRHDVA